MECAATTGRHGTIQTDRSFGGRSSRPGSAGTSGCRRQGHDRGYDEISDAGGRQARQHAREMMVQRAALIVRVARAVVVRAAAVVNVVVMGVARGVSRGAGLVGIGGGILLARDRMLEMHGDQRHDASQLGHQKQPQQPAAEPSSGVPRKSCKSRSAYRHISGRATPWWREGHSHVEIRVGMGPGRAGWHRGCRRHAPTASPASAAMSR